MTKGCIYYTDCRLDKLIMKVCQDQLKKSFSGEIISVSLKPIEFGRNIVLDSQPSAIMMFRQILVALEASNADTVFFCEHDVLYSKSRFDFEPLCDDVYYYNTNVWRWKYPEDFAITYDGLTSLSGLCANRRLLLNHYKKRLEIIKRKGWEDGRDPNWARKIGYEPGKKKRRGGFMDEKVGFWRSEFPDIDIRHKHCLTPPKVSLDSFKHKPANWRETSIDNIEGWNLKELFNL